MTCFLMSLMKIFIHRNQNREKAINTVHYIPLTSLQDVFFKINFN